MRASAWQDLMFRRNASVLESSACFFLPPWSGPLSLPQRAIALQPRRPLTWRLPRLPLEPINFRCTTMPTLQDLVEGRLAGAFTQKCYVCPNAESVATARRLFVKELASGSGSMQLDGEPARHALELFPLEVWDVIAAHIVSPVLSHGLYRVPKTARALAMLSCTCAPLYEAAAAGWACLGSHVAPLLHVAWKAHPALQGRSGEALFGHLAPSRYVMSLKCMTESEGNGVRRALDEGWSRDELMKRRVSFRSRGRLCMRCMQYATENCINHACRLCCGHINGRCTTHACCGR